MSQRRWVCPSCGGGVNGPQRPRSDDVRRFCLPCSAKSGRLVRRECPSLERERTAARERATARRAKRTTTERQREAESRSVGGVDLLALARRLWALPYLQQKRHGGGACPPIELRRSRTKWYSTGHCVVGGGPRRIVITLGVTDDPAESMGVVLHELVHAVLPSSVNHDERFWRVLQCAARDAWPDATFRFNEPAPTKWHRQHQITMGLRGPSRARVRSTPRCRLLTRRGATRPPGSCARRARSVTLLQCNEPDASPCAPSLSSCSPPSLPSAPRRPTNSRLSLSTRGRA